MPELLQNLDVSRETIDRLRHFSNLLEKWTKKINLIAPNTVPVIWERHILDSAQLFQFIPSQATKIADLGSGGGLPAIVLSILSKDQDRDVTTTMIESDVRKATFLRTSIRELSLDAQVKSTRLEDLDPLDADVVTARALAPLDLLLGMVDHHLRQGGTAILPKGRNFRQEIDKARENWMLSLIEHTSVTDNQACLLEVKDIMRVTP